MELSTHRIKSPFLNEVLRFLVGILGMLVLNMIKQCQLVEVDLKVSFSIVAQSSNVIKICDAQSSLTARDSSSKENPR